MELVGGLAPLVDGCIVVVAGHIGRESRTVGTCPVREAGASVCHVEREGDTFAQHLVNARHHLVGRACLVLGAPFVKPSAPVFRAHQRCVGAQALQLLKLLVYVGSCAKVHGPHQVVECVLGKVACPVALKHLWCRSPVFLQHVTYGSHIGLVFAIGTILVLHL